jgi:hypothetical protein
VGAQWALVELDRVPTGEAHMVSPDGDFFDTFALLAMRAVPTDSLIADLPVERRLATEFRVESAEARVERLLRDERVAAAIPDDARGRAQALLESLARLEERAQLDDEEATMTAGLDAELVDEFIEALHNAWKPGRLFRAALGHWQRVERMEGDSIPDEALKDLNIFTNKRLFLPGELRVLGNTWQAESFARELLKREEQAVLAHLENAPAAEVAGVAIADTIRATISNMRDAGYEQLVVLIPHYARLIPQLQPTLPEQYGGAARAPGWTPPGNRNDFRGEVAECPVFHTFQLPRDRLAVIDFSRWALWREWLIDGSDLKVTIEAFTEEQATQRVAAADSDANDQEKLVRNILLSALISAQIAFTVAVEDPRAARWLTIPAEPTS